MGPPVTYHKRLEEQDWLAVTFRATDVISRLAGSKTRRSAPSCSIGCPAKGMDANPSKQRVR